MPRRLATCLLGFAIWGLGGATCWADGIVCPDTAERDHPVAISIETDIPDGARIRGPGWILSDGLNSVTLPDKPGLVIVAAKPGVY